MNWDDTRFFLALAREGTLSAAARVLNTRHTTVARRIQSLEEQCATTLFISTPDGYLLTEQGELAMERAISAEEQMLALERTLQGSSEQLTGKLRITTEDVIVPLLGETLRVFRGLYPGIELSVLVGNKGSDLHRREADIAVRVMHNPPEDLVGRRIATFRYAAFSKRDAYDRWAQGFENLPWIMWDERLGAKLTERWFEQMAGGRAAAYRIDTTSSLVDLINQGAGVGVLPIRLGRYYGFEQLGSHIEELDTEAWVLTHPDLCHAARIVAFMETLREYF